ncbi:DUF2288 domain-containing protein [Atopomonas sediminilitoris]|uniref:DUF2288 domain-containing protein n=1 Tax=Atopomonas sediminilitoris TaxID=2919919 RepID=UPI001F4E3724|nr:DUF2288 domain-containing protein [Atopomonas sediminilitoris]MCJ8169628.1 DUF2288 domain-containing protein [Atopomonas sediminilitoris]
MTEELSTLYTNLLAETARISWAELMPFFARGQLLWVAAQLDLVAVAEAIAEDRGSEVSAWMQAGLVMRLDDDQAQLWQAQDPDNLWAVVLAPWVLVQQRTDNAKQ